MLPNKKYTPSDGIAILKVRWPLIVGLFVVAAFGGLLVSASLPNVYQSDMLIQIVPQRVPDAIVRSTITMKTENRIQTIEQQAKSRTHLEQIIQELNLYPAERAGMPMEDVIEVMRWDINVDIIRSQRDQPAEAFYVRFKYRDAALAAKVTARLGSLFVDENARERERLSRATNEFLQRQLATARARLEEQENKLKKFREQYSGRLPSEVAVNMQTIQSTQLQLSALVESTARDRDRKLMLERLYNDAANAPLPAPPPAPTGGDPAQIGGATPQQQLDAAKAALARMELRLKPEHPDISRAKRLIADLTAKAEAAAANPAAAAPPAATRDELTRQERLQQMRAEIESLDRQIKFKDTQAAGMRATISDHQGKLASVPGTESQWVALTRDYDTVAAAYKDLLAKSESSKVSADLEAQQIGEQFRVLDAARIPLRPISPVRWQINAVAAAAGLGLGLALTVLLEIRDSSYRSETDIIEVLRLPVVALVPFVESAADRLRRQRRKMALVCAAGVCMVAGGVVFWAMKLWQHVI